MCIWFKLFQMRVRRFFQHSALFTSEKQILLRLQLLLGSNPYGVLRSASKIYKMLTSCYELHIEFKVLSSMTSSGLQASELKVLRAMYNHVMPTPDS